MSSWASYSILISHPPSSQLIMTALTITLSLDAHNKLVKCKLAAELHNNASIPIAGKKGLIMDWWLIFIVVMFGLLAKSSSGSSSSWLPGGNANNFSDSDDYHRWHTFDDEDSSSFVTSLISTGTGSMFDDHFSSSSSSSMFDDSFTDNSPSINPANGLPMVGCVDICGNAYGTDSSHWEDHSVSGSSMFDGHFSSSSSSMFADHFSSSSSSTFDDSFSSPSSSFND